MNESMEIRSNDLKGTYNRNLAIAFLISVGLHLVLIGFVFLSESEDENPGRIALAPIPPPRSDTNWSLPISLAEPKKYDEGAGGGSPDVDAPVGPAQKGRPDATPDRSRNRVDKTRSTIVKNPDKVRAVEKEPKPADVAGDMRDTSRKTNVVGTKGQNPNGTGDRPAGGSGGVGVGFANGIGGRGWVVRPRASYPSGINSTGTVVLRFMVMPNGDITNITPVKRADESLVKAAISGLRRAKARPLPEGVPQVPQQATIPFTFELH